ncbi:MAG: 30S ribosomal protein S6--L-glutamate ligase [Raineya sp.]|jgi:ribosomal protein S6--L-glutamate ligase|nr:30S ribosomal protein S6--L-glutamate ligase [Raineya sp.]
MKIAILSRKSSLYSTRRLVESAKLRGHQVEVINHSKCYMVMERENPAVYIGTRLIQDVDAIIPRIGASVTFYGSAVIRQFEMQKVFTTVSSLALIRSRDKLRSLQIMTKAGVDIPKTAFADHSSDIDYLIQQVGGPPVIIKLLEGTQGLGVVLAETQNAAKSVLEAFYGLQANILVQEYIKEAGGADVRAFVVDGKVVASMKRQSKKGDFRSNLHRGGEGKAIELSEQEIEMAEKAAKAMSLPICGVDMLQSQRGPLIIEVNSSPGLEGIEGATKVDIAGKIIEYVERNYQKSHEDKKDKIGL